MPEPTLSESPLVKIKEFYNRLPQSEHTAATQAIINDLPQHVIADNEWYLKQLRLLLSSLRDAQTIEDAHVLFCKMFDRADCRMIALRFYYLRWLLFAVQKDAYNPPFHTSDERFIFAKVSMLMRDDQLPESTKKVLLAVQ